VSSLKKLLLDEALMHAAEYGNTETVKSVVASGADTNHRDFSGTALHRAAGNGHTEVVRALLESGANPRSQNGYGGTPAFVAEASGHREIVEVLRAAKGREP
jgi:ankyrin repeat protein